VERKENYLKKKEFLSTVSTDFIALLVKSLEAF